MKPGKAISRRVVVRALAVTASSGILGQSVGQASRCGSTAQGKAEPPQALALIGDRYHNSDFIRVALDKVFRALGLSIDYTINYADISATLLRNYRLFICFRDGMIWPNGYLGPDAYPHAGELENPGDWPKEESQAWITEEQGEAIKGFVLAGNGLYALHNSSHISLYSKSFREVMGGAYIGHPPLRPFKVKVVNKDHPITKGVKDFMVNDEQHYMTYDKDPANIILRSENIDGLGFENLGTQAIAGWAYNYGKGRVVFTAVGHTLHALWQPEYLKVQENAVRWLLRLGV